MSSSPMLSLALNRLARADMALEADPGNVTLQAEYDAAWAAYTAAEAAEVATEAERLVR